MLTAQGIHFAYGRRRPHTVLSDLSWEVPAGKTTLLLGANGAGKSTLLKLLSGFMVPREGTIEIRGARGRRALYQGVGWMPQEVQPARGLTVADQIEYAAWLSGASHRDARTRAEAALVAVDLVDKASARTDRISGGQMRRVGLAQALVRQAPVLLLDEPTAGLDPAQALNFRSLIRELDCPGGIVISTHQVNDLADDVDHVAVLAGGTLIFNDSVESFRAYAAEVGGPGASLEWAFSRMVGGGRH